MKKLNLLLGSTLCLGLMGGMAIPANAATDVTIEIEATDLNDNVGYVEDENGDGIPDPGEHEYSVTVPAVLPIVFNADGTNTLPTTWTINNHSDISGISLTKVEMNANGSGWKLLPESTDTKTLAVDTKEIQFYAGKEDALKLVNPGDTASESGSVTWENGDFSIEANGSQVLSFDVNRGAFNNSASAAKAFEMTLSFEFNK